ncbi:MAG: hypothetical protein ACJ762_06255 [Solirubrobacteraceae bacterium]
MSVRIATKPYPSPARRLRRLLAACVLVGCALSATASASPVLTVQATHAPSPLYRGDAYASYTATVTNGGDQATTGSTTLSAELPAGMTLDTVAGPGWTCSIATRSCSTTTSAGAGGALAPVKLEVTIDPAAVATDALATFTAAGGGSGATASTQELISFGPQLVFGLTSFSATANDDTGADYTQAGGHPFSANTSFGIVQKSMAPATQAQNTWVSRPFEDLRDAAVNLPPGFVANPTVMTGGCTFEQVRKFECPERFAIGRTFADLGPLTSADQQSVVYKMISEKGYPAEFGFRAVSLSDVTIILRPKLRPGDFGITALAPMPPQSPELDAIRYFTFCTYGANVFNNAGNPGSDACRAADDPKALDRPFLTNPTQCDEQPPVTTINVSSYQHPGRKLGDNLPDLSDADWKTFSATAPKVTGCDAVPFAPSVTVKPTSTTPDAASGLDFGLDMPQDGLVTHGAIASAHLKTTVLRLPPGYTVNPSAATGLAACTDEQLKAGTNDEPQCPDAAKLGAVQVTSPLIDQTLAGDLYLARPKSTDPASGDMLRLFLVVRNDDIGVLVKLKGSTVADPQTGQLTATFDENPKLPFDHLSVRLRGGDRGVLAGPQRCGPVSASTTLTAWNTLKTPVVDSDPVTIAGDCGFGFTPVLTAGNANNTARGSGTFSFRFTRRDGEQWVNGLTAILPTGLLASVKDLPLCSDGQAAAGACPAASRVGTVDATAGTGDPFVLEHKGTAYLTEGYKGCAYGLQVSVPVIAGPFDGKTPETDLGTINVRQSVCVDPIDAHVTVTSDPLPTIWHGIPLRVRSVTVSVDRAGFMLNPSACGPKATGAAFVSPDAGKALASSPFQVTGCDKLAYRPKLAIGLTGAKETRDGGHPGVVAVATQQPGEAGIKKVEVALPLALALDPDNAQELCEYEAGLKYDCPATSIVGQATAVSPLLNKPLTGPVYFVKNVRFNAQGQPIRTLPTLLVKLAGEIAVNLRANTNVDSRNRLVNTFGLTDAIPDAPISSFTLAIDGGRHGIVAVTHDQDVCRSIGSAVARTDGHNDTQHDFFIRMGTPCDLQVSRRTITKTRMKVTVGGLTHRSGKVTISGKAIRKTSRKVKNAQSAVLTARLTGYGRRLQRRHKKLPVTVTFAPTGAKRESLTYPARKKKR